MVHGVGVIGAGPGVAALHLPTLARLPEHFAVVHVSDGGSGAAVGLASRMGARASTGTDELLADPAVEVVAICSPPAQHAPQILASVAAGTKAVLCEKPLALTAADAEEVIAACRAAGTLLLVGTNHLFDPAWARTQEHLAGRRINTVSVTLALPPNGRYHELVTDLEAAPPAAHPPLDFSNLGLAAGVVRQLVIGLGVHDLPALRQLVPHIDEVISARALAPIGYAISARGGDTLVHLSVVMLPEGADALWRMSIDTSVDHLDIEFPPAFVHDGSARTRVWNSAGQLTEHPGAPSDGYVEEWRALVELLDGNGAVDYDAILADALYAIGLADAAHAAVLAGVAQ